MEKNKTGLILFSYVHNLHTYFHLSFMDRPLESFPSSHPILVGEGGEGGECSD